MCGLGSHPRCMSIEFKKLVSLDPSVDYYVIGHTTSTNVYTLSQNHIERKEGEYWPDITIKDDPEYPDKEGYYQYTYIPMIELSKKLQMLVLTRKEGRSDSKYVSTYEFIWSDCGVDFAHQTYRYEEYLKNLGIQPNKKDEKYMKTQSIKYSLYMRCFRDAALKRIQTVSTSTEIPSYVSAIERDFLIDLMMSIQDMDEKNKIV